MLVEEAVLARALVGRVDLDLNEGRDRGLQLYGRSRARPGLEEVQVHHLRLRWPTPSLVVSIVALVVALGGVAYATSPEPPGFGHNTGHAAAGKGAECTLGEVLLTAGSVANGMPANGELLQIRQDTALFALLGTTYGGDGKTTFALPNLRSVTPNHMTYSICDRGVFPSRR